MACSVMVLADIGKYRPKDFTSKDRNNTLYSLQQNLASSIEEDVPAID